MNILGLNLNHADTSACLIKNGEIIALAEEERFQRIKHYAGFPEKSIDYCLNKSELKISDIDYVSINTNAKSNFNKKIQYTFKNFYRPNVILKTLNYLKKFDKNNNLKKYLLKNNFEGKIIYQDHHLSHIASSYYVSGFDEAIGLTIDGFGDFCSSVGYLCKDKKITAFKKTYFPHSLGILYQAITQFLGFANYGDEYKVMGLAPYGKNKYAAEFEDIIKYDQNNFFKLNLKYFDHHKSAKFSSFNFKNNIPYFDNLFSKHLEKLFQIKQRKKNENLTQNHFDIAFSLQKKFEDILIMILNDIYEDYKIDNLCLSGGCALNSKFNGLITSQTGFKNVYIQPNSGDGGGSLGSALCTHVKFSNENKQFNFDIYGGKKYENNFIKTNVIDRIINKKNLDIRYYENREELNNDISKNIADSKIVGWFNNGSEWGPRALGNRSILADPRNPNIKMIINSKIKLRESFRPFAPSVLKEYAKDFFDMNGESESPFMIKIFKATQNAINKIPSVVHVDQTCRVQTVKFEDNKDYYNLIKSFYNLTSVPVLLNTSFNENEPIVMTPQEAYNCFDRTDMDVLVLQDWVIKRKI